MHVHACTYSYLCHYAYVTNVHVVSVVFACTCYTSDYSTLQYVCFAWSLCVTIVSPHIYLPLHECHHAVSDTGHLSRHLFMMVL